MAEVSKLEQLKQAILAGNIPQMVLLTISHALDLRSSDIHIEPQEQRVRIRYRVDGVLRQIVEYPNNIHPAVVSRIKIMSDLKIDEQRIPQDGRTQVTTRDGREMDLRVSTLPTVNGEKVVMRIQDKSRKIPSLKDLGLDGNNMDYLENALESPNGIILNSGPTGSGKTTTLYSCLSNLNTIGVNILTIEDPVEIQMDGLSQSQVHPDINYTFAYGLRSALRQDPDIIMVGEIRDKETIDTAIEASLTGHLVFSTIHTNSAVETLTRIDNLGVPSYLVASTIECIIAQRLVRKICKNCKVEEEADPEIVKHIQQTVNDMPDSANVDKSLFKNMKFYVGKGCDECEGIGYKGRLGIYEVLKMNNKLRRLIIQKVSSLKIGQAAIDSGMITLEQDGIIKALKGQTSLEEVYRVAKKMETDIEEEEEAEKGEKRAAKQKNRRKEKSKEESPVNIKTKPQEQAKKQPIQEPQSEPQVEETPAEQSIEPQPEPTVEAPAESPQPAPQIKVPTEPQPQITEENPAPNTPA